MPSQTPHGLEYPLRPDNAALIASDPPTNSQGWFEKGWRKLDAAAGHFIIPGSPEEVWITRNAIYTGTVWNRENTGAGASGIVLPSSGGLSYRYTPAGSNPISWSSRDLVDSSGYLIGASLQDGSVTTSKIADKAVTREKVSFPARLTSSLTSDYTVPKNPQWDQILGVNAPSAGRILIIVQQAVRFIGSSTQTFNGSLYIGGVPIDPIATLRTGEANYTASIPLVHTAEISGATTITYAVSASETNSYQVVAQGTFMSVVYLPES